MLGTKRRFQIGAVCKGNLGKLVNNVAPEARKEGMLENRGRSGNKHFSTSFRQIYARMQLIYNTIHVSDMYIYSLKVFMRRR